MIIAITSVTACGVKSIPNMPNGGTYPAQYPSIFVPIKLIPSELRENNPPASTLKGPNGFWQYPNTTPTK